MSTESSLHPAGWFLERGSVVDHFEIARPIGRGGMGEVYLARDMKLGRKVALKVIHPESIGSREAIDRFLFEAKTTARFNHPHIVTIHDVGEYQGCPYMALEYLEGQSLRERMEERPGVRESLRIGLAIAEALRAAHQHDILHRDLKPENVLLPRDGTLRVLDFGLAKPVVALPEKPALTRTPTVPEDLEDQRIATADTMSNLDVTLSPFETEAGQVQGTPSYMAPEQWMDQPCTPATDIWAFGVVLRELITGRRPFEELKAVQLAFTVCSDDPVPKVEVVPDAPAELSTMLDQCLEKDHRKRPSSSEVVEALERMVYGGRVHLSDEESPFRGLLPFAERHADFFFGREAEIGAFLERVREGSVLPIVGPSGVGKSSFVQAGVIPRLKEQGHWLVYRLRPGRKPFHALASRLLAGQTSVMTLLTSARGQAVLAGREGAEQEERRAEETLPDELATLPDKLMETPSVLALLLQQVAREQKSRVLLYLDQLEELYTLVQDERTRRRFMEAVCTAADDPQGPVRVILTLRDDFLSRLARGALVREAFSQVTVLSDPDPEALEEILVRPLEPTGYSYDDPALVPEMIEAVRGESAALPLLQFTTRMLWDSRDRKGRKLLRATYEAMGGVAGALAKHADGVLEGLSPDEVAVARDILLRLVTPDGTRQALSQTQLLDQLGPEAGEILDRLTSARLITVRKAHAGAALDAGGAELELVHESLIRGWRQLARWMDEGREELAFRAEVAEAAKLWDRRGRRDEEVWRGDALYDALRVLERCSAPLPDLEQSFINAGREREERVQRRKRQKLAINGGLLVLITLISVVVAISFGRQKREATRQRAMAEDRRAAAQIESASSALARGDLLEARAQLRASLETKDSTLGRALWMRLGADPLLWRRELGATAFDVAISPDGRSVAVACQDRSIYLFDEQTLAMRVLRGHQDQAVSVAFSPKGDLIASGTWDGRVRIWNARRGTVRSVLKGHRAWVWQLAFSPDGRYLASASWDKTIRIWNLERSTSTTEERVLEGHTDRVYGLAYSPDGTRLASGGFDKSIRIWDPRTGKQVRRLLGHTDRVYGLAYSPDGKHLASGSLDRTIRIWSPESKAVNQVLQGHTGGVYSVVWATTPAGPRIVSGSWDHTIRLWDPRTGDELKQLRGHTGGIYSVAINAAGTRVASASTDKTVRYWSLTERAGDEQRSAGHGALVWEAAFSPDGKLLASGGQDKRVIIWDVASGRTVRVLVGHTAMVTGLAVSPDGRTLASASSDRTVRLWDLRSGAEKNVLLGHTASVYGLAFSPDGRLLASGSSDKTVRLWDVASGKLVRVLTGHTSEVFGVTFSPDGRRLATASRDRTVRLWEVSTGRQLRELRGHEGSVTGLAFSPDGRTLASGSDDRSVRLWDLERGTSRILGTHEGRVYFLSFSPDGKRIASPSSDGTARIWEVQSGRYLTLLGHRSEVNAARFSPDGEQVATTSDDGTVRLWSARTGHRVWRSPGLLSNPSRIFSHQGWTTLGPRHRSGDLGSRTMDRAVEQSARLSESEGGRIVCLQTRDGRVELWDAGSDRRLFEERVPGITAVVATSRGCLALVKGAARLYGADGANKELLREATAIAFSNETILVAAGREIQTFDVAGGRRAATYEVGVGVSTMTWLEDRLAIGFEEGNIELVSHDHGGERHPAISFREIPSSPVVRLLAGPMHTLIGGYANGLVGIWNVRTGRLLHHTRLHGPVRHIVEKGPRIVAVSDLGDHRTIDMGVFHWDYCDLLQQVWQKVRVRWEGGLLVTRPPPGQHPCTRGQ